MPDKIIASIGSKGVCPESGFHISTPSIRDKVLKDIGENPEFLLKEEESEDKAHRCVKFHLVYNALNKCRIPKNRSSMLRLVKQFFNIDPATLNKSVIIHFDQGNFNKKLYDTTLSQFYIALYNAHNANRYSANEVLSSSLTVTLYPHQLQALYWMINQERQPHFYRNNFVQISSKQYPNNFLYFNPFTCQLSDTIPLPVRVQRGGILADDHGLGKTVTVLGLILSHRQNKRKQHDDTEKETYDDVILKTGLTAGDTLSCYCKRRIKQEILIPTHPNNTFILCPICKCYQHQTCIFKNGFDNAIAEHKNYICSMCWNTRECVESTSTLILTDQAIQLQWLHDIYTHTSPSCLQVYVYYGLHLNGWINPVNLAKYDVVIADYATFVEERKFSREQCNVSPLSHIKWWRVCLDDVTSINPKKIRNEDLFHTTGLLAINRWIISSTSMENPHIFKLLFHLLDGSQSKYFEYVFAKFVKGDVESILDLLKTIMWRTSRQNVLCNDAAPCLEVIHKISLRPTETIAYDTLRAHSVYKLKLNIDIFHSIGKFTEYQTSTVLDMIEAHNTSFIELMTNNERKNFLRANELIPAMLSNSDEVIKENLLALIHHLMLLSALYYQSREFDLAVASYKRILSLDISRHSDDRWIAILSRIHALYNIIEIRKLLFLSPYENENYAEELARLETICTQSNLVMMEQWKQKQKHEGTAIKDLFGSLKNVLSTIEKMQLVNDVSRKLIWDIELIRSKTNKCYKRLKSMKELVNCIKQWFEKVETHRHSLEADFEILNSIITNDINSFTEACIQCHHGVRFMRIATETGARSDDELHCELCVLKFKLVDYEKLIHGKKWSMNTYGSTYQDQIISRICEHISEYIVEYSAIEPNIAHQREILLHHNALIKEEYKSFSSLLKAMTAVESSKFGEIKCKKMLEVNENCSIPMLIDSINLIESRLYQVRKSQSYVQNQSNQNMDGSVQCPICFDTVSTFNLLECGHHSCCNCTIKWFKRSPASTNSFTCPMCRRQQSLEKLYDVVLKPEYDLAYSQSSKIDKIVGTIMQLKEEDADAKIVIYSYSGKMVTALSNAMNKNGISFYDAREFSCELYNFESGQTTCYFITPEDECYGPQIGISLNKATHLFFVDFSLSQGKEVYPVSRIHCVGQTRRTFIHRFIATGTHEEKILRNRKNFSLFNSVETAKYLLELIE